ncbi:tetratricopeptide repeat protein [Candidatus Fermentibacteria bacterium]|nr:tetratricopeptide repeat protein [Candidatus Fermentibacteria bacterium]
MVWLMAAIILGSEADFTEISARLDCDLGSAYLGQNLLEQAESEFRDALELIPGYHDALLGLGMVYSRRGSWETAERYLRSYVDSVPGSARGCMELAEVLRATGRSAESSLFALRAAESSPDDPACWLLAGETALSAGDTSSASTFLQRAMPLGGRPALEAATLQAGILLSLGDEDTARALLEEAWGAGHAEAGWLLGRLYTSWGDYLRGLSLISQALSCAPRAPFADSARMLLDSLAGEGVFLSPGDGE